MRVLEPKAPPGPERLEALSSVSDEAPCVLRFQPLILGLYEKEANELVKFTRALFRLA